MKNVFQCIDKGWQMKLTNSLINTIKLCYVQVRLGLFKALQFTKCSDMHSRTCVMIYVRSHADRNFQFIVQAQEVGSGDLLPYISQVLVAG